MNVFDENILHIMHFTGNQTVQGPKDSFSANCSKGFKQHQMVNNGLIKWNDLSFFFKNNKV